MNEVRPFILCHVLPQNTEVVNCSLIIEPFCMSTVYFSAIVAAATVRPLHDYRWIVDKHETVMKVG